MIGACVLAACVALAAPELSLWDEPATSLRVVGLDAQGVRVVRAGEDVGMLLAWDRVEAVGGEHADDFEAHRDAALAVWRARTRLERGDLNGAARALEPVADTYLGETGPTSQVVAGVLMVVALERADYPRALDAWASWQTATRGGSVRFAPAAARVDAQTGLAPELFPLWAIAGVAPDRAIGADADERLADRLYALAAGVGPDGPGERSVERVEELVAQGERSTDAGVSLLVQVVGATSGDGPLREASRVSLLPRLDADDLPPWQRAWIDLAVGRSLAIESNPGRRTEGVLRLLTLAARDRTTQPLLAGYALAEASRVLSKMDDPDSATRVREDLKRTYPGHPAIGWLADASPQHNQGGRP